MRKKSLIYLLITVVVMLLLPYLAVTFANGDGGMAICFILFFAVNPIWSVLIGIFAGRNIKALWFHPLLSATLFLAGAWMLFDMGEPAFLLYTAVYVAIGVSTMLVTFLVGNRKR